VREGAAYRDFLVLYRTNAQSRYFEEGFLAEGIPYRVVGGVGFYARPAATGKPEAVLVNIGSESGHPVLVATRDKTLQVALAEDETAVCTSKAVILIKKTGQVCITDRSGGVAVPLATKADLDALRTAITGAVPVGGDGGAALKTAMLAGTWPVGTQILKGQ